MAAASFGTSDRAEPFLFANLERADGFHQHEGATRHAIWQLRTAIQIVRTDAGTGGLSVPLVVEALEKANLDFAPANISFVQVAPIDYIDSDFFYYDIDSQADINLLRSTNSVAAVLNIYFTEDLVYGGGQICGISSFSYHPSQGVVMRNASSDMDSNPSTFTHELGHYFDLFHAHETAHGIECVDGSSCETAGNQLCDTPADPGLRSCEPGGDATCVDFFCNFVGDRVDPCSGDPYRPLTDNMMASSLIHCRTQFTPEQNEHMEATLLNLRPDHVDNPIAVDLEPPDGAASSPFSVFVPPANPSSGIVRFAVGLTEGSRVRVDIIDSSGRLVDTVANNQMGPGLSALTWNGDRYASGIYFLRIGSGDEELSRAIVLVK
jgi:hypothetical protein